MSLVTSFLKKIRSYFLLILVLCSYSLSSQTTLSAGDIIITIIQCDGTDEFRFIPLVDLEENTIIYFTDNGWQSDNTFRANEGIVKYTAPSGGINKGTMITYTGISGDFSTEDAGFNLSASGDQVLAYQGSTGSPTFIFAVQNNSTQWQTGSDDSNQSDLPSGLTNDVTAVATGASSGAESEYDNAYYSGASTGKTHTQISVLVGNSSNWTGDNDTSYSSTPPTSFTFSSATWDGSSSTDWSTSDNWSTSESPGKYDDVVIADVSNNSIISTSTDITIDNLTINSSSELELQKNASISLTGNFSNSGTVTLNSDSDEFAVIIVQGTSSGSITYKRFVNEVNATANTGWDLIGSPVAGQSISGFSAQTELATSGSQTAIGIFDNSVTGDDQWINYTGTGSGWQAGDFVAGKGYAMATDAGGDTVDFTGTIATDAVTIAIIDNIATGSNWDLIANPFPSYLNANNDADPDDNFLTVNTTKIDGDYLAVYGYDADGSGYTGYGQDYENDTVIYIAPGQGFMVASDDTSSDTVSFTEAMQTVNGTDDFIENNALDDVFEVLLRLYHGDDNIEGIKIKFQENMTAGLDPGYDLGNYYQNAAIMTRLVDADQGTGFQDQQLPLSLMDDVVIPLEINQTSGQEFRINLHTSTIGQVNIYLEDTEFETLTLLNDEDFVFTPSSDLSDAGRFYVHLTADTLSNEEVNTSILNAYKGVDNNYITIEGLATQATSTAVSLYNILGTKVMDTTLDNTTNTQTISTNGFSTGIYIIKLESGKNQLTKKLIIK